VVLIYQADLALVFGMGPLKMLHAWSLAVEERFYLLWPLALLGLLALKNLRIALTAAHKRSAGGTVANGGFAVWGCG